MKETTAVRVIDELGRLVLPIETRRVMGWDEKTPVEIWVNSIDGELVLKRHTQNCTCCGSTEGLTKYQSKYFCPDCIRAITSL